MVKLNPISFAQLLSKQAAQGGDKKKIKLGLLMAALRGVAVVRRSAHEVKAFDTGAFVRAWTSARTADGAILYNPLVYSATLEIGRRPGLMPPVDPLVGWVHRVLQPAGGEVAERRIALAIARKIKAHGTKPRFVVERVLPELKSIATQEVARVLGGVP